MPKRQIGPFILERQIGVGGMGVVYLATYPKTGKKVAVKILSPALTADQKLLSRFEREIDILKRLDCPNIVKYYGGGTENQQRYYAMQYIDGGSLQDVLKKRGKLSWEQAIHVGRQVCTALEHAHNAGIIHRDLKPGNLFLTSKGRLMLGDFGIARDTEATALTAAGKTVGTYAYMAPEQIQGGHPISRKTDIYALGCLLFEVLTGETPFQGSNAAEMLLQHLNDEPPNVSEKAIDCPIWLDQLIDEMLQKNPDDRPYDALAVHTRLGEIRDKIARGDSVVAQTTVGGSGKTKSGEKDLRKTLQRKKKKKPAGGPIHEQTWFLASCLVALLSVTVWLMWPPGEDKLYEQARTAMQGDEIAQRAALEGPITKYLDRFPDGKYAGEMKVWADEIHVDKLEAQMEKKAKGFGEVENDYERRYIAARNSEDSATVNPLSALQQYRDFVKEHKPNSGQPMPDDLRRFVLLFDRRIDAAREKLMSNPRRMEVFRTQMQAAEDLLAEGKGADADRIWSFVKDFFRDEQDETVQAFRDYADRRLQRVDVPMPRASEFGE
ncbi:MAG: serine/threonine-protein kinase [Planctomycetaceae bacterium]